MRWAIRAVHDIWCVVTRVCRISAPSNDPDVRWLREQEYAAQHELQRIRQRRNDIETDIFGPYEQRRPEGDT